MVMQLILIVLGVFIGSVPMVLITIPIFLPIINLLGLNGIWFVVLMPIKMDMTITTPPFGMILFVIKGFTPSRTTMRGIYKAGLYFLAYGFIERLLILVFPFLALWLPNLI